MGRLIDADKLQDYFWDNRSELFQSKDCRIAIDNAPTVEAIPKADYENRLIADMVAMLKDLQLEIEECIDGGEGSPQFEQGVTIARVQVVEIIQQKINNIKETGDATDRC